MGETKEISDEIIQKKIVDIINGRKKYELILYK